MWRETESRVIDMVENMRDGELIEFLHELVDEIELRLIAVEKNDE